MLPSPFFSPLLLTPRDAEEFSGRDWKTYVREGEGTSAAHEILSHDNVFLGGIDFVFGLKGDIWMDVNFALRG